MTIDTQRLQSVEKCFGNLADVLGIPTILAVIGVDEAVVAEIREKHGPEAATGFIIGAFAEWDAAGRDAEASGAGIPTDLEGTVLGLAEALNVGGPVPATA